MGEKGRKGTNRKRKTRGEPHSKGGYGKREERKGKKKGKDRTNVSK